MSVSRWPKKKIPAHVKRFSLAARIAYAEQRRGDRRVISVAPWAMGWDPLRLDGARTREIGEPARPGSMRLPARFALSAWRLGGA